MSLIFVSSYSQSTNYAKADSVAILVSKSRYKEVNTLTLDLIRKLDSDEDKYRAIVKWISLNVKYKLGTVTKVGSDVLKKKKAVCAGYSLLVKEMCDYAGIPCEVVSGDAKTTEFDIGSKLNYSDHAWNKVYINNEWHYSDVTWVTSSYNSETRKYTYKFNETYFLAEPEFFNQKHFPENKKDLIEPIITKREYKNRAIPYSSFDIKEETFINFPKGKISKRYKLQLSLDSNEVNLVYKEGKNYYKIEPFKIKHNKDRRDVYFNTEEVSKGCVVYLKLEGETIMFGVKK